MDGSALMRWATQYLNKYRATLDMSQTEVSLETLAASWSPPSAPSFKINVDGAIFTKQGMAGLGVLVWDELGRVIIALSKRVQALLGAVEVKAKAFEAGMQFAKDIGVQDFILEGGSLTIYQALSGLSEAPTSVDSMVQVLLSFNREFRKFSFSHVRRQGNKPAHLLAKHVKGIVDFSTWLEENPCFLEQTLLHDVISIANN